MCFVGEASPSPLDRVVSARLLLVQVFVPISAGAHHSDHKERGRGEVR